ncbi:ABC transporter substrate-binding protein [Immundisolibacter sp.]|uniref:ABC transporter substrate-binding protein n=1 Tax=Immundisolibacter sp. TaxID=1934948 RepID=UPI0035698121
MVRRLLFARFVACASLPLWLAACVPAKPLSVGVHPWIGYESFYLAGEFGWLPPGVAFQQEGAARDSLAALKAGTLDAATLTLDEVVRARAGGLRLTVVLVLDVSSGVDMVLAQPGITRLANLAGKRIGVERSAMGALVLKYSLMEAGLAADAVTVVELSPDQQLAAWRERRVDAVVTYGPNAALLLREGAVKLLDSRKMPANRFGVLAVRHDRLPGREDALRALLGAHFRALEHLRNNRPDAVYRIAAHQGIRASEVVRAMAGVSLPDLAGNRHYLAPGSLFEQEVRRLNEVMTHDRLVPLGNPLVDLVDAGFLPSEEAFFL